MTRKHSKMKSKTNCDVLVEHLDKRFPDLPLIKAFEVFDPQKISSDGHGDGENVHGNDFISQLCNHYGIDECTAQQEWESLRILLQEQEFKDKSATQVMKSLSNTGSFVPHNIKVCPNSPYPAYQQCRR